MIKKIRKGKNPAGFQYNKNSHQKEFEDDLVSKFLHLSTGFGGGKSHGLVMKSLRLSAINRHLAGGLVCPSYADFKRDLLPLFEEIFYDNDKKFYYNGQDHYFKFPWSRGKLWVASGEKKLRGPNWAYACINELTLLPLVRYKEVIGRVRLKASVCPQIASVGTPEGMASEYYDVFIEKPWKNLRIIYGDTRDNAENLDETYVQSLEDSYDDVMLDTYLKGLWVNMTGNRFYYSYDPDKHLDKEIKQREYATVHVSMDFNVDPMTCVCWNFDGIKLSAFDEITIPGNKDGADTNQICIALKKRGYDPEACVVYPDPAGKARSTNGKPDHKILEEHGFTLRKKAKAPLVRQRQLNVNNVLNKGYVKINPDKCPGLKKDFMSVELDPVTLEKVKKNKKLTHYSDGFDYMCDILFPYSGKKPETRIQRIR